MLISSVIEWLSARAQDWYVLDWNLERWDRGYALLRSPTIGRNGHPILPGFAWWSSFNWFMISTIKITIISTKPLLILMTVSFSRIHWHYNRTYPWKGSQTRTSTESFHYFKVKFISQSKLDHHLKHSNTGRTFLLSMELLNSAHIRYRNKETRTRDTQSRERTPEF